MPGKLVRLAFVVFPLDRFPSTFFVNNCFLDYLIFLLRSGLNITVSELLILIADSLSGVSSFNSFVMDMLLRKAVHEIWSIRRQNYISNASIL